MDKIIEQMAKILRGDLPEDTHDQYLSQLDRYKEIIDRTPNKFLRFHLDDCIKKERYELAQYIKDKAQSRGFDLGFPASTGEC